MATNMTNNEPCIKTDRVTSSAFLELVVCSLCQGILWIPKACKNCETPYCSTCIKNRQAETSETIQCPNTCSGFVERKCPVAILYILKKLEVKCRNTIYGCNEILPYNSLETHEEECIYRQKICSGCEKKFAKKDLQEHHSTCSSVALTCSEFNTVYHRQEKTTKSNENSERLVTLTDTDLRLIHNFLTGYNSAVTWQLTHGQNIKRILKPRLEIFFTQLGCNLDTDKNSRINYLITEYKKVLTIWRTHYENIFKGLKPLLETAVLDIRRTYNIGNN